MATTQPTLYGKYEYAKNSSGAPGNLYGAGFVPQTYTATLSDSDMEMDDDIITASKILAEVLAVVLAEIITATKALSDTQSHSEAFANQAIKRVNELVSPSDSRSIANVTKILADFFLVKEWVSIRLIKALVWTNPVQNANTFDSLYAVNTKGPTIYAGKNILYGGLKPSASWTKGTTRPENWSITDGFKTIS